MDDREHVIVVGAGAGGLVVAHDLAAAGIPVTVLEAAERVGGQLAPIEVGGVVIDAAAESYATRSDAVAALAAGLGLETVLPLDSPAWLIGADGRAAPLPAASVLGIPAVPFAADVLATIGAAGAWRAQLDKLVPMRRPDRYPSLGDLVRRRMGPRVLERLVDPVVRGVHSAPASSIPIGAASPDLPQALRRTGSLAAAVADLRASSAAGSQVGGIRGGMHRLAEALAQRAVEHGAVVRTGVRVVEAGQNAVVTAEGERLAGRVVVAAPGVWSEPSRQREITLAIAVVDAPDLDAAPRGTGALIAEGAPGIAARAFTHSSAKWEWLGRSLPAHRHVVRLSYDWMPEDPESRVLADLRAITGADVARLEDLAIRSWVRTLAATVPADGAPGPRLAGEAASGTGLATIVPRARQLAADLVASDLNASDLNEGEDHDRIDG